MSQVVEGYLRQIRTSDEPTSLASENKTLIPIQIADSQLLFGEASRGSSEGLRVSRLY